MDLSCSNGNSSEIHSQKFFMMRVNKHWLRLSKGWETDILRDIKNSATEGTGQPDVTLKLDLL